MQSFQTEKYKTRIQILVFSKYVLILVLLFNIPNKQFLGFGAKTNFLREEVFLKQARKSSEDTQVAGYARFKKVWAG